MIVESVARAVNKKVDPPSEKGHLSVEETQSLKDARGQAASPECNSFGDYSEMVTQVEHCVLWSPLLVSRSYYGPDQQLARFPSDAFKIAHQVRRPIPSRTDSIGPWLETLGFLTRQGALTNSALIYLFRDSADHASSSNNTHHYAKRHHDPPLGLVPRLAHHALDLARLHPRPHPRQAYPRPRCVEGRMWVSRMLGRAFGRMMRL